QLLTAKEAAPPGVGVFQVGPSRRLQGRVDVPIVVDAFRQVSQEIGPELPHVLGVVDDERDVLEMPESGRVDPRVTPEDHRIDPATGRTGHPGGGRTVVHLLGVKAATLRERGRSKVSRERVRGSYQAGESGSRVKASLWDQGVDGTRPGSPMSGPGLRVGVPPDAELCSCSPRSTGPILAPGSSQAPSKIRSAIEAPASERDISPRTRDRVRVGAPRKHAMLIR